MNCIGLSSVSLALVLLLTACGGPKAPPENYKGVVKIGKPYNISGKTYYPSYDDEYDEVGMASWYGPGFHGKSTANGERMNSADMTAAHTTLPMPSFVRVTNLENGRSIVVRVNDRGPFAKNRIIDLSERAADELGIKNRGVAKVRVQFMKEETDQLIAQLQGNKAAKSFAQKKGSGGAKAVANRDSGPSKVAANELPRLAPRAGVEFINASGPVNDFRSDEVFPANEVFASASETEMIVPADISRVEGPAAPPLGMVASNELKPIPGIQTAQTNLPPSLPSYGATGGTLNEANQAIAVQPETVTNSDAPVAPSASMSSGYSVPMPPQQQEQPANTQAAAPEPYSSATIAPAPTTPRAIRKELQPLATPNNLAPKYVPLEPASNKPASAPTRVSTTALPAKPFSPPPQLPTSAPQELITASPAPVPVAQAPQPFQPIQQPSQQYQPSPMASPAPVAPASTYSASSSPQFQATFSRKPTYEASSNNVNAAPADLPPSAGVPLNSLPPTTVYAPVSGDEGKWYVQAGSFGVEQNARNMANRLSGIGTPEVGAVMVGGKVWYRVRIGPVGDQAMAQQMRSQAVNLGVTDAKVIGN